ncbi:hypothetical protein BESB_030410 [Besnoitia besnoiti]|uniref:Uncharacterized protein n=1 Tax=Besnoitia besnoiti TaxID=94643 RepID=A0A2A9M697_BESBE|nr:hypothetical protein BESB_030410 [Besnoitia besnoiti]PFH31167.1 hypothetical protein BESB_030410 [Besnoitia besnoiti]
MREAYLDAHWRARTHTMHVDNVYVPLSDYRALPVAKTHVRFGCHPTDRPVQASGCSGPSDVHASADKAASYGRSDSLAGIDGIPSGAAASRHAGKTHWPSFSHRRAEGDCVLVCGGASAERGTAEAMTAPPPPSRSGQTPFSSDDLSGPNAGPTQNGDSSWLRQHARYEAEWPKMPLYATAYACAWEFTCCPWCKTSSAASQESCGIDEFGADTDDDADFGPVLRPQEAEARPRPLVAGAERCFAQKERGVVAFGEEGQDDKATPRANPKPTTGDEKPPFGPGGDPGGGGVHNLPSRNGRHRRAKGKPPGTRLSSLPSPRVQTQSLASRETSNAEGAAARESPNAMPREPDKGVRQHEARASCVIHAGAPADFTPSEAQGATSAARGAGTPGEKSHPISYAAAAAAASHKAQAGRAAKALQGMRAPAVLTKNAANPATPPAAKKGVITAGSQAFQLRPEEENAGAHAPPGKSREKLDVSAATVGARETLPGEGSAGGTRPYALPQTRGGGGTPRGPRGPNPAAPATQTNASAAWKQSHTRLVDPRRRPPNAPASARHPTVAPWTSGLDGPAAPPRGPTTQGQLPQRPQDRRTANRGTKELAPVPKRALEKTKFTSGDPSAGESRGGRKASRKHSQAQPRDQIRRHPLADGGRSAGESVSPKTRTPAASPLSSPAPFTVSLLGPHLHGASPRRHTTLQSSSSVESSPLAAATPPALFFNTSSFTGNTQKKTFPSRQAEPLHKAAAPDYVSPASPCLQVWGYRQRRLR